MNGRLVTWLCVVAAVISASIAAIVVTNNRAAIARARAAAAESDEARAQSEAKKALAERQTEEKRAARARDEAKAAEENRKAKDLEARAAEETAVAEREANAKAQAEAKTARDRASAAADERAAAKSKADEAKMAAEAVRMAIEAEVAKSNAMVQVAEAELALERQRSSKVIAERDLIEMRKIDFETIARELAEREQQVAERERALVPDKTAADLVWVADRDADELGGETNRVSRKRKGRVLKENDMTLPFTTRRLAKMERLEYEAATNNVASVRARIISTIEPLMIQAIRDDRIVDADFYYRTIKQLYPDWTYKRSEGNSK